MEAAILDVIPALFLFPLFRVLPVFWMQLVAAFLLTAMGLHWTLKSVRRLYAQQRPRWAQDPLGKVGVAPLEAPGVVFSVLVFLVMFKSSLLEAAEIVLVVTPVAAGEAEARGGDCSQYSWYFLVAGTVLIEVTLVLYSIASDARSARSIIRIA